VFECISYAELIHTERTHVRDLRVIDLLFHQRMIKETWLDRGLISLLFPSLDKVIKIHGWCSIGFIFLTLTQCFCVIILPPSWVAGVMF